MAINSIFDISTEEEQQVLEQQAIIESGDTMEVEDAVIEEDNSEQLQLMTNELSKDVQVVQEQMSLEEELVEQYTETGLVLEKDESEITDEELVVAHESFIYSMMKVGVNRNDLSILRLSSESYNNKRAQLTLSRENIKEVMSNLGRNILNLLVNIGRKLTTFVIKIINLITDKNKLLIQLDDFCYNNYDKKLVKLHDKDAAKILDDLFVLFLANKDNLDFSLFMKYIREGVRNPFLVNIDNLYSLATSLETSKEDVDAFYEKIKKDAKVLPMQQQLIDYMNKESTAKENILYVVSVKGSKVKAYVEDGESGLGYKEENYNFNWDWANHAIHSKYNTYGDLSKVIKELITMTNGANSYLNSLTILNKKALDRIKKLQKDYDKTLDNVGNSNEQVRTVVLRIAMKMLRDIGSSMMFELMSQYAYNTNKMIDVCRMLCRAGREENEKK